MTEPDRETIINEVVPVLAAYLREMCDGGVSVSIAALAGEAAGEMIDRGYVPIDRENVEAAIAAVAEVLPERQMIIRDDVRSVGPEYHTAHCWVGPIEARVRRLTETLDGRTTDEQLAATGLALIPPV